VLRSRVPSALAEEVKRLSLPGIYLDAEPIREYPEGSLAAQVLGFVGRDFNGLSGLELSFDKELAGTPGIIDTERDTGGQEISLGRRLLTPSQEGADLVLTIDRYVQRMAERLLNQAVLDNRASGGLILILEPRTGNILAAANNPTYNLTAEEIFDPRQADRYKSKIVTDQYEPGSTLKTIAMARARR
jgi:stage V sporulation protein D (sporulation-specific penicillin-binding protein)